MPVKVPEEPKKYTTVYENFKGVDFTNDPSNVYRRRSPSGLNMLPDLAGNPHKRTGWDIKFSKDDFIEAAGVPAWTQVTPERLHHFSYGSHDYLMIFNSIGVFYTRDDQETVTLAQMATKSGDTYTISQFPPEVTRKKDGLPQTVVMPADANKAFFFEGGGEAGFYVFVENDLYKFSEIDTGGMYFVKVEPRVPVVIIGATPAYGSGTNYESLNMLTDRRAIQYFGDGTAKYVLPEMPESINTITVEILDMNTGKWEKKERGDAFYSWSLSGNEITFTNVKPDAATVDNVRITYLPQDTGEYVLETGVDTEFATVDVSTKIVSRQLVTETTVYTYDSKKKKWVKTSSSKSASSWSTVSSTTVPGKATLSTPGIYKRSEFALFGDYSGRLQEITSYKSNWGAYNSSVTIDITDSSIAKQYGTKSTYTYSAGPYGQEGDVTQTRKTIKDTYYNYKEETYTKTFHIQGTYTKATPRDADNSIDSSREAFSRCRKVLPFGNNITNQIFISASTSKNYTNRVWYCAANDPTFFPDTNYIEVGADDKPVMGLINVDQYLGLVKMGNGSSIGAALYLAYPTSFEDDATYAVKQSVSGVGAISTGAFNILNEEPLFLSERGVMGIDISTKDTNKQIRNRSYFINKKLLSEQNLSDAVSYVFRGLYYLAVNNRCYVLDGSQKSSWANEKTNLQYECYYLENIPAQCFADMAETLYFSDFDGNLCYFKEETDLDAYVDIYSTEWPQWTSTYSPQEDEYGEFYSLRNIAGTSGEQYYLKAFDTNDFSESAENYLLHNDDGRLLVLGGSASENDTVRNNDNFYTVREVVGDKAYVSKGVPIYSRWSTLADDDELLQFFKNLNKKGCVVSLYPENQSGVEVWLKPDEKDPVKLGILSTGKTTLPFDAFIKKKIKKYKRLQIICINKSYNNGFGVNQIIKTYTVGNYSKNRR